MYPSSSIGTTRPGRSAARLAKLLLAAALGTGAAAGYARAELPRSLDGLSLDISRDSLLTIARLSGYRVDRDLGQRIEFAPRDTSQARLSASLDQGRVNMLLLVYPQHPTAEDFESKAQDLQNWFGPPSDALRQNDYRRLVWSDPNTALTLKAGFASPHVESLQVKLVSRSEQEELQESAPEPAPPPAHPAKKARPRSKTTHRTHHRSTSSTSITGRSS